MNKADKLQVRIDSSLKQAFKKRCEKEGFNMSQVIESMIRKAMLETSSK